MAVDINSEDGQIIRQLIPLSTISTDQFETLCNKITINDAEPGTYLFKKDDNTDDLIYLIEGSVSLQSDKLKIETIESGTESSRFAIAHHIPRKIDAFTNTTIRFLRLNIDFIDALPSIYHEEEKEEDDNYMVIDEDNYDEDNENDDDWMTTLLKSPIFKALPPANLQQIIMGLEEVTLEKGEQVVKQGNSGDYFYLIKKGQCLLSRKPSANAKEINLGKLKNQDTFGEDALISGEPRNVNITALTSLSLLRLSKDKFISLIKEPALQFISHAQITDSLSKGATLIDVRPPDEYKTHHLPNSISVPFFSLRMQIKALNKKKPVLIVCANGRTSEAAAFLLLRNKFTAFIVTGGMEQEIQTTQSAPATNPVKDDIPLNVEKNIEDNAKPAVEKNTENKAKPAVEKNTENKARPAVEKEIENDSDLLADNSIEYDIETQVENSNTHKTEASTEFQQNNQSSNANKVEQNPVPLEKQKLLAKIEKLTAEKAELERKYRVLYTQMGKLKILLNKLKKRKK